MVFYFPNDYNLNLSLAQIINKLNSAKSVDFEIKLLRGWLKEKLDKTTVAECKKFHLRPA